MSPEIDTLYEKLTGTKNVTLFKCTYNYLLQMLVLLYLFGSNHTDDDRIVVILIIITFESIFFLFL